MNKFIKVLAASSLIATALVGCGGESKSAAAYTKVGLGIVSTLSDDGQVNTTMAALGLDKDGKIAYIDIDVAQSTPGGDEKSQLDKTKKERGADYAMKEASPIKKEWNEQAEAFEAWAKGKTPDEVAKVETMDFHGGKAAKEGTDLAAGCTITIDEFLEAVAKAASSAETVDAAKIGIGDVMSNNAEDKKLDTTIALVATDADGKVVYSNLDVAQIYKKDGTAITKSKKELQGDYAMKEASPIKKEWFEQGKAFEDWAKTKTADEIAKVETMDFHGGKAAKEGTDLAAGCTMTIDDFLAAYAEAFAAAK